MKSPPDTRVLIVGAGLGGALMACMLARRGYRVEVFERRPDPRAAGFIGGRSINLALSTRGIHALAKVELAERVLDSAIPMPGRMMHSETGRLTFQPYSKDPTEAINSVSRGGLNLILLEAAGAHENVSLHFGCRCLDVDIEAPSICYQPDGGGDPVTECGDLIIGADGAFSAVRGALQRTDRFDFSQSYLRHGYKELTIPPTADGEFAMDPHALHIWPRGGSMMIALPNQDRTFTCTLFWPFEGPESFEAVQREEQILPFFRTRFVDAVPLMPTLVEDYQKNPIGSLLTIRCAPWHYDGKVVLLGDAAHAIVPFFGQGMNAAFEDCSVLDECIERGGGNWEEVLPMFSAARHENADAIADMALHNFVEMRDHVGSSVFLIRKRFQQILHRLLPGTFTPLYNMVSFSNIPYAQARRRAVRQSRLARAGLFVVAGILAGLLLLWLI